MGTNTIRFGWKVCAALAILLLAGGAWAVVAQLDQSYGQQGRVIDQVPGPVANDINVIAVQSDGRVVAATAGLRRFNTDGTPDLAFGTAGVTKIRFRIVDIVIDASDTIFVLGNDSGSANDQTVVAKFSANGAPDVSFGSGGVQPLNLTNDFLELPTDLLLLSSGNIIVSGCAVDDFDYSAIIAAQLLTNGTLDPSFGTEGIFRFNDSLGACVGDAAEFADGIIFTGGRFSLNGFGCDGDGSPPPDMFLYKVDTSGVPSAGFGSNGQTTFNPGCFESPSAIFELPGGGIFVAGTDAPPTLFGRAPFFAQFDSQGAVDNLYADQGALLIDGGDVSFSVSDVKMLPGGEVLFAGTRIEETSDFNEDYRAFAGRLTADRTGLDGTFGSSGIAVMPSSGVEEYGRALGLLSNGDALLAGGGIESTDSGADPGFGVIRSIASDGSLISEFGDDGEVLIDVRGPTSVSVSAGLGFPDGEVLVAGEVEDLLYVAAYEQNGQSNLNFGDAGYSVIIPPDMTGEVRALAAGSNGDIYAGASLREPGGFISDTLFGVYRLDADGAQDMAFGIQGFATANVDTGRAEVPEALLFDGSTITIAGNVATPGSVNRDFALARFNQLGEPDSSFGSNGVVMTAWNVADYQSSRILALGRQSDGKLIAGGTLNLTGFVNFAAIARYNVDGSIDTSFGVDGLTLLDFGVEANGDDIIVLPDDTILVLGTAFGGSSPDINVGVARLTSNGSLDLSFADQGFGIFQRPDNRTGRGSEMARDSEGNILVAVQARQGFSLLKLSANGEVDSGFGNSGWFDENFGQPATTSSGDVKAIAVHSDASVSLIGGALRVNLGIARVSGDAAGQIFSDGFE